MVDNSDPSPSRYSTHPRLISSPIQQPPPTPVHARLDGNAQRNFLPPTRLATETPPSMRRALKASQHPEPEPEGLLPHANGLLTLAREIRAYQQQLRREGLTTQESVLLGDLEAKV